MRLRVGLVFATIATLLCTSFSGVVFADTYNVTASVNAPLPSTVPIIDNSVTSLSPTTPQVYITGTCEIVVPTLIVVLIRNDETIGSGSCSPQGTFRILVGLVLGENIIYPRYVTITNQVSGLGQAITITYAPKTTQPNKDSSSNSSQKPSEGSGLKLVFDYDFVTYNDLKPTSIKASIEGGTAPYVLVVTWADGTQTVKKIKTAGPIELEHSYRSILPASSISLVVTDASGAKSVQTRALVSFRGETYVPPASQPLEESRDWLFVYLIGVFSFCGILLIRHFGHEPTRAFRTYHKRRLKKLAKAKKRS